MSDEQAARVDEMTVDELAERVRLVEVLREILPTCEVCGAAMARPAMHMLWHEEQAFATMGDDL